MHRKGTKRRFVGLIPSLGLLVATSQSVALAADAMPNACPVDGCVVKIVALEPAGEEIQITFESNFTPDVSKNHFHVWWGENFSVEQVGRNAEPEHGVEQGNWHRHADYPVYTTQGAASASVRGEATTLCVTAADRGHNVLDVSIYDCKDASALF